MKIYIFTRVAILNVLWIVLACFIHDADAQTQVLIKENGGASWHGVDGGVNLKANCRSNIISPAHPNSLTTVTFPSEEYDLSNSFDPSIGVFSPSEVGYYIIMASVNWESSSTSPVKRSIKLIKNGIITVEQNTEQATGNSHSSIHALVYNYGSDNFRIQVSHNSGSSEIISGTSSTGEKTTFTAFGLMNYNFNVAKKINGGVSWDLGTNMSTKIRAWRDFLNIPTGGSTVKFLTENYDINNDFHLASSVFTPPEPGYYVILADISWDMNSQTGTTGIQLIKNGSSVIEQNSVAGGNGLLHSSIHSLIYSDGTDNYSIGAWHNATSPLRVRISELTIFRIQSPNDQILSRINNGASFGEEISIVKAKRSSKISIPSGTPFPITYSSEDFDVNNNFDPGTGVFSPSQEGFYVIMATANWDGSNASYGKRGIRLMKQTGAASTELQKANYSDGSGVMTSNIHTVIFYDGTSGHSYFVEAYQDSGASHDVGGTSVVPGCIFTAYKL